MSGPLPPSTPHSLLGRMLQRGPNDEDAWREFIESYGPLVTAWCLGGGLRNSDAEDVIQKVLLRLFRYLHNYKRSDGRFRDWLRTIVRNATSDHRTKEERDRLATQSIDAVADLPDPASLETRLENQLQREILMEARERVRVRCKERDWIIFCRLTDEGSSPQEAAREYGLTVETIYKIKSAILKQVRQEVARLEEEGFDGS